MLRTATQLLVCALLGTTPLFPAKAMETDVSLELELRGFSSDASQPGKFDNDIAASLEPDFQGSFNDGNTLWRFTPFGRWDSRDEERRHGDIRELYLLHVMDHWEALAGISKVFWGVAESSHLVDVINQTDYLEGIDGEDKLGQPMLRLSRAFEASTLTLFALPGFRERDFLGSDNPLALPFEVNNDPVYEDPDGENNVDFAVRYSGYHDIIDYGVSWFHGTSRDAGFIPGDDGRLRPFYPQIDQIGLDLQVTSEAWLWKLEVIRRTFDSETAGTDYTAAAGGVEYSFYGVQDGRYDLGLLAELHHDSRDDRSAVLLQDDLFVGLRFGFTDAQSTEILAGAIIDLEDDSRSFRIEGNRRVFESATLGLEAQVFSNVDPDNLSHSLRDSDFVLLSLEWFF